MTQPSLFDEPQLLPTLSGMVQGIVGMRPTPDGPPTWARNEFQLQCQDCYGIEKINIASLMTYQFPHCQTPRRRLCPDCHKAICDGGRRCQTMPGMERKQ